MTGGGPGAMEAGNLGAYLADKSDEEANKAIEIIATGNEKFDGLEYLNREPAFAVLTEFGPAVGHVRLQAEPITSSIQPSLGIPTYRYGHEPSNLFASWHAKFFQNALREDGLLAISTGGIIYTRGGAGTRQEIFQAACNNTYTTTQSTRPMVFIGVQFWQESGLYDVRLRSLPPSHLPSDRGQVRHVGRGPVPDRPFALG